MNPGVSHYTGRGETAKLLHVEKAWVQVVEWQLWSAVHRGTQASKPFAGRVLHRIQKPLELDRWEALHEGPDGRVADTHPARIVLWIKSEKDSKAALRQSDILRKDSDGAVKALATRCTCSSGTSRNLRGPQPVNARMRKI
jgi:hypothetical protein